MTALEIVMLIALLAMAVFLIVAVLMQHGQGKLSGSIAGGAETYYGNEGSKKSGKLLKRLTTIVGIVFVLVVAIAYIAQPDYGNYATGAEWENLSSYFSSFSK